MQASFRLALQAAAGHVHPVMRVLVVDQQLASFNAQPSTVLMLATTQKARIHTAVMVEGLVLPWRAAMGSKADALFQNTGTFESCAWLTSRRHVLALCICFP
jgi:hypothetical protein